MTSNNLQIVQVPIKDLKEAIYNPRKMDAKQEADLMASIKQFSLIDPLIVNGLKERRGIIIGGHQRFKIARKLGYKTVPVVYVNLDEEKEKILNLRLNRNQGSWDYDMLKNFEMETLLDVGFDQEDLGMIWNDVLEIENDDFDEEKELAKIKTTNIKAGDLFTLGQHRLYCGDSLNPESAKKLMGEEKTRTTYTDSPYNISLDYDKGIGGKKNYGGHVDDTKSDGEFKDFLKKAMLNAMSVSEESAHYFFYCDQKYIWLLQTLYAELGIKSQRVCLWIKNGFNVTPQCAFNKAYEPCVYGTKGKPYIATINNLNEILNKEIGTGNRTAYDIVDIFDIWLAKRLPGNEYEHPTSKPATLHEKPLRRCTKVNDIVLDLFAGSGSLMVSCEQLKRRAYMIEKEPIFCQLIINRYEKLTGLKAKKIS